MLHTQSPQESVWRLHALPHDGGAENTRGCSAAAEFGQEIGHAEEDPHRQEVGAESQQGQRVQEAGVQPEVTHRQQAAQVLLDHPLPRPNADQSRRRRIERSGGGVKGSKWVKKSSDGGIKRGLRGNEKE